MTAPVPVPRGLFFEAADPRADFLGTIRPGDLVHFVLNIGDADAQLVVLPEVKGVRRLLVVDVGRFDKVENLIRQLQRGGVLPPDEELSIVVVATHPHKDHIAGMPRFLRDFRRSVAEYWDSGFRFNGADYERLHQALEELLDDPDQDVDVDMSQPTAGTTRFLGDVRVTVLAPAMRIRSRYDTFGVEVNDASIVLKLEFPMRRLRLASAAGDRDTVSFILGGDAQTLSLGAAMFDFPKLFGHDADAEAALRLTLEAVEPLEADVFKVPHHLSKRGVNLELVERISPRLAIGSCKGGELSHRFPHEVAQNAVREGLQPVAVTLNPRHTDWHLGLLYTSDRLAAAQPGRPGFGGFAANQAEIRTNRADVVTLADGHTPQPDGFLGSVAVVASPNNVFKVWRFRDRRDRNLNLANALRYGGRKTSLAGLPQ